MTVHDFIFSTNRWYRLSRHLCFWLGWFLFSGTVQMTRLAPGIPVDLLNIISQQFMRSLNRFPGIFLFCYFVVYIFVPRFTKNGKLRQFIIVLLSSFLLLYLATFVWFRYVKFDPAMNSLPLSAFFYYSFYTNINFTGTFPTCCLMLAIKYYKNWSVKQQRSEQLGRENIQAELQLLKAQVHPHFLFNTLNNIYSFVLNRDDRAANLVDKLAGMIDYMRTEGENSLVPLEKEIRLIKDYVGLERVRYGDRLELKVDITGENQRLCLIKRSDVWL
jgi:sensor histidine kinase YesM